MHNKNINRVSLKTNNKIRKTRIKVKLYIIGCINLVLKSLFIYFFWGLKSSFTLLKLTYKAQIGSCYHLIFYI